jgi:hypothetical protein
MGHMMIYTPTCLIITYMIFFVEIIDNKKIREK